MQSQQHPAVSVIVPLYNKAAYIARCLESICSQTFTQFEVLVVDDGSTDGSGRIAGAIGDDRIRIITQPNAGEGAARNRGIAEARADLVAFLDADDAWKPGFLDAVTRLGRRYPEAGILATGYLRLLDTGTAKEITLCASSGDETRFVQNYFQIAVQGNFITSSSVAIRRRVFQEVGNFAQGEPIGADIDLWARIALRYPVAFDTRILAIYHSEAEGRSFERWRDNPPYPLVVRTLRRELNSREFDPGTVDAIRAYLDTRLLGYAYWLLALGRREHLGSFLRTEHFETRDGRMEAAVLRMVTYLVPLRLIGAIKSRVATTIPTPTPDIVTKIVHRRSSLSAAQA